MVFCAVRALDEENFQHQAQNVIKKGLITPVDEINVPYALRTKPLKDVE
jgi:hypothetical protein